MSKDLMINKMKLDLMRCNYELKSVSLGSPYYFYWKNVKRYIEHTIEQMDKNK